MAVRFDPRGDLSTPNTMPYPFLHSRPAAFPDRLGCTTSGTRRLSSFSLSSTPRPKLCYDWIFSSSTNVHIAIDQTAFKEYVSFESYVLALSDDRHVHVQGIGTVELKIRRSPASKESHVIQLQDVLHIPSWPCNIFSDTFFNSGHEFDHVWNQSGVQFTKREIDGSQLWGYTETFCSLDRLVLGKRHKEVRSPMLEDKDREIFAVNAVWPHSQRDRWQAYLGHGLNHGMSCTASRLDPSVDETSQTETLRGIAGDYSADRRIYRRATLSNMNANAVRRGPNKRSSSLKATTSETNLLKIIA